MVVLVVAIPVAVLLSGAVGAAVLGGAIKRDRDTDNIAGDGTPNEYLRLSDTNPYLS